ncbi:MAG TPA: hypothetical protein VIH55_05975 [Acidimicrobiia bacterium]
MNDLTGTVVAIIDDGERAKTALTALAEAGYGADLLYGDEGRAHLSNEIDDGITSVVKRLVLAFGDEVRIIERFDAALADGASVVSVDVEADQAPDVASILEDHDGHDMWRLGEWSFNRLGEKGAGEG